VVERLAARLAARTPLAASETETRLAAVVAVVRLAEEEPELLFIKRALREGDPWSGHMAFPGGRAEPFDASLEQTAVRETWEEVGLDLSLGRMLGRLDDLAPRSPSLPPIMIRPFVAVVPEAVSLTPNEEVADHFWVPITHLRDPAGQIEHELLFNGNRVRFPAYQVHGHVVWGLTERIVRQLLPMFDP
jgi:8-oxo-dGTP pyrophosphatase MutT (NUDIX family)